MTMHSVHNMSTSATTMSTYGINYFNDTCSSGECSDGYQSSISPVSSPALGHYNYSVENYGYTSSYSPKKGYNYQNDCSYYQQTASNFTSTSCSYKNTNQVDCAQNSSYKLNVQIKPYTKTTESQIIGKPTAPEKQLVKVNRFVQHFNQQHEDLSKRLLEQKEIEASSLSLVAPPPEILKKRRVAANARERRRMNNLNFAFDR